MKNKVKGKLGEVIGTCTAGSRRVFLQFPELFENSP